MTTQNPRPDAVAGPAGPAVRVAPVMPVTLDGGNRSHAVGTDATDLLTFVDVVPSFDGDVTRSLAWAAEVGQVAPQPGSGRTSLLWELLASTAAADVGVARILEPHLDALAILAAAAAPATVDLARIGADASSTWGVYAAEGPGVRVTATQREAGWVLDGVKPWCSLARHVSHALVTAWTEDGRSLFAVDLRARGVTADDGPWVARGLAQVVSAPVCFEAASAVPVGPVGWYLSRPGFAWGGIGVAACWWGGAVGVARDVFAAATRREPDQLALAHLGALDTVLAGARAVLLDASHTVDAGSAETRPTGTVPAAPEVTTTASTAVVARRVRGVVARAVEETLARAGHALGPGPLARDETHARRVADLALYVRQHHGERDDASLGRDLVAREELPW